MQVQEFRRIAIICLITLLILAGVTCWYIYQLNQEILKIVEFSQLLKGRSFYTWRTDTGIPIAVFTDTIRGIEKIFLYFVGVAIFFWSLAIILFWKVSAQLLKCHRMINNVDGKSAKKNIKLDEWIKRTTSKLKANESEVKKIYNEIDNIKNRIDCELKKVISNLERGMFCTFQFTFPEKEKIKGLQRQIEYLKERGDSFKENLSEVSKVKVELEGILDYFQNIGDVIFRELVGAENICKELLKTMESTLDYNEYINKLVETMAELSTQVNLITVNLAVEATRLGKDGKGVANIAEELKDINSLIVRMEEGTTSIVNSFHNQTSTIGMLMEKCLKQLEKGIQYTSNFQQEICTARERMEEAGKRIEEIYPSLYQQDNASMHISEDINEFLLVWEEVKKILTQIKAYFETFSTSLRKIGSDVDTVIASITCLKDKVSDDDFSG